MLLLTKGKATKALCNECRKLYEPTEAEIESQRRQRPVFICQGCVEAINTRMQEMAEEVPELRDHRLKRWRSGCDCERCQQKRVCV